MSFLLLSMKIYALMLLEEFKRLKKTMMKSLIAISNKFIRNQGSMTKISTFITLRIISKIRRKKKC